MIHLGLTPIEHLAEHFERQAEIDEGNWSNRGVAAEIRRVAGDSTDASTKENRMAEEQRRKIILTLEVEYDVIGPITNEKILEKALRFAPARLEGQADLVQARIVSALDERDHMVRSIRVHG